MNIRSDHREQDQTYIESTRIYPLLSGTGDQRLLLEWIESHDRYTLVDPEESLETAKFDCCILDGEALETHLETLRVRKRKAEPILLPCLLLTPEADLSHIDVDKGEVADSVLFETVDEVVSIPIKKAELEWRTEALLRLRSQSLDLDSKRRSLELFKQATEAAGHAVYITDTSGVIEYVNPAFEEMTGYRASEAIGETPKIINSGNMSAEYFDQLWETIIAGESWEEDIVNQRKDGSEYHAHQTIAPVIDDDGTPQNFVAIQSDVTQYVEAEEKLSTFRDIVERVEDPIMLQDRDGTFRLINQAVTEFADMSREELHGADEYAFMDEASADEIAERKQQVLDRQYPVSYTISPTFPSTDGETFSTIRYPYYGKGGSVEGTIAICRNVTELELRDQQLEIIDRVLRHNLRNKMTSIGLFAEQLTETVPEEEASHARRIHDLTMKVNRMIEKQRKLTKFLTDPPDEKVLDLVSIVEKQVAKKRANNSDADIRLDTPDSLSVFATATIEEAVAELLTNAIEHSKQESPTVTVEVCESESGPMVIVRDDGPGISNEEQTVLTRGNGVEPLFHASGLGLWLVNLVVTLSGGTVTVAENDPVGSVVKVQLKGA